MDPSKDESIPGISVGRSLNLKISVQPGVELEVLCIVV